jgi:hypothetical protein
MLVGMQSDNNGELMPEVPSAAEFLSLRRRIEELERLSGASRCGRCAGGISSRGRASRRAGTWQLGVVAAFALVPSIGHGLDIDTTDIAPESAIDAGAMIARFTAIAQAVTALEGTVEGHTAALADIDTRITSLEAGLSGPRIAGTFENSWSTLAIDPTDPTAEIENFSVTLTTHGRDVRVELAGDGDAPYLGAMTGDPFVRFVFRVERRTEGIDADWINVEEFYFGTDSQTGNTVASLSLPPSVITAVDTPSAGSTTYRVLAWHTPEDGLDLVGVSVSNVRIFAQELAVNAE